MATSDTPVSAIMAKLHGKGDEPDAGPEDDGGDAHGLQLAAEQLIHAVHAGNAADVVHAFSAMFDMMEALPHDEADEGEGGKEEGE